MLVIEQAIEIERLARYPDRPSRLRSSFACTTLEVAKSLADREMFGGNSRLALWACELERQEVPVHIGTFRIFEKLRTNISYKDAHRIAHTYWSASHPTDEQELIAESPLRLTQHLYDYVPGLGWEPAITGAPGSSIRLGP